MAKLFLGGLAQLTQKQDIEEHFSMYGTIIDAVVMFKDGRSRGFGFVTFAEPEAVTNVLADPQVIHDKTIDCKPAVPSDEAPPPRVQMQQQQVQYQPPQQQLTHQPQFVAARFPGGGCGGPMGPCGGQMGGHSYEPQVEYSEPQVTGYPPQPSPMKGGKKGGGGKPSEVGMTDKVFIGGLAPTVSDEMLTAYFGQYGNLVDVVVMKDKLTQKSRGFGFVRYDNTDSVDLVMAEYDTHEMEGKWIEVKRAIPQDRIATPAPQGFAGGKGGGFPMQQQSYGYQQKGKMAWGQPTDYGAYVTSFAGPGRKGPY